jgi:predicted Rossmann fold flavoprotein
VRFQGKVTLLVDGREQDCHTGELLFTEHGISGIPAMQVSGQAARAIDDGRTAEVSLDLLPEVDGDTWEREKERRLALAGRTGDRMLSEWLFGLVPDRVMIPVLAQFGLVREKKLRKVPEETRGEILRTLRDLRMRVTGTEGFEKAQVTGGGIPLSEIRADLSSVSAPGIYIAGELLDADGICGGYNLRWAFSTGAAAGAAAAAYAAAAAGKGTEE